MARTQKNTTPQDLLFLEEIKRQWLATIDALVDPLMIIDKDYNVIKCNKALAALSNSSIPSILGTKCYKAFANRQSPCNGCQLNQAVKTKKVHQFEIDDVRGDNVFEITSQPLSGNDGDQFVHIYKDRTNAKRLQERLTQQEKLASIGLLAGGIAHEINNPLGGILIFSQMLMRELPKDSSHYEDAAEIENAAQRCKEIVGQLLEFARSNTNSNLEPTSLHEAIEVAIKFAKMGLKDQRISIKYDDTLDNQSQILADKNKLIQVILNIIQNAIHACKNNGEIHIVRKFAGSKITVSISDTGSGIKKSDLNKIFDPFFTTKEPGEGTGLGLSICYRILNEMGAKIKVESKNRQGTTFTLEFDALNNGDTQLEL